MKTRYFVVAAPVLLAALIVWLWLTRPIVVSATTIRNVATLPPPTQSAQSNTLYIFRVTGISMLPAIRNNQIVLVVVCKAKDLKVGDIIVYKTMFGNCVAHRIIFIGEDEDGWYAFTAGDNNSVPDDVTVRARHIIGVMVH